MTTSRNPTAAKRSAPACQLKIVLLGTEAPVWRRLRVPGNASLDWLHAVLQVAMGWTNSHLHHFLTRQGRYADPAQCEDEGFGGEPDRDETKAALLEVAPAKGSDFRYEYDFGDSWEHQIILEEILPPDPAAAKVAVCLDGARACPPEDCGGVWGYADLLEALKNRKHPRHQELKDWIGGPFDAEAFNRLKINLWLRELKWPHPTEDRLRKVLMGRDGYGQR
jgi:hypothetical protein